MKAIAFSSPGVVGARPSNASEERIWVAVVSVASAMGGVAERRAAVRFPSAAQPVRRAAQKTGASKERSGKSVLPVSMPHARRHGSKQIAKQACAMGPSLPSSKSLARGQVLEGLYV